MPAEDRERLNTTPPSAAVTAFTAFAVGPAQQPDSGGDGGGRCGGACYHPGPREARDAAWWRALAALAAFCAVAGLVGAGKADKRILSGPEFLTTPAACARDGFRPRQLLGEFDDDYATRPEGGATRSLALWMVLSLLLPLGLGLLWLHAWAQQARRMLWFTAGFHCGATLAAALLLFAAGAAPGGVVLLLLALLVAASWYFSRAQAELCARLLSIAAHGLRASPGLIGMALSLWLLAALGVALTTVLGVAAYANGAPIPNPLLTGARRLVALPANATATDLPPRGEAYASVAPEGCLLDGLAVPCCAWRTHPVASAYLVALAATALWGWMTLAAGRRFVIASVIAQFYYAPAGEGAPPGALRAAVEHATGPQAGTVAFAGAVLAAVNALQQAAQAGRRSDGSGGRAGGAAGAVAALLCGAFRCVASIVLALVEFLCRYSLVWAALTGQGLVDAGRAVTDLLKRNCLEAAMAWWMPALVVTLTSLAFSLAWGALVYCVVAAATAGGGGGAVPIALGAALAAGVVLHLLGALLLDAVDCVFVCYARDRDAAAGGGEFCTPHPEVAEVFDAVCVRPAPGAVVSQPHGGLVYGAAARQVGAV